MLQKQFHFLAKRFFHGVSKISIRPYIPFLPGYSDVIDEVSISALYFYDPNHLSIY